MYKFSLFTTCPRGLEHLLESELTNLGCDNLIKSDGGISCRATQEQIYKINLHSRIASRVLLQLTKFEYHNEQDIFENALKISWGDWFKSTQSFKVKVEGKHSKLRSLDFISLKIKDAICDYFRAKEGIRPNVDKFNSDVAFHAFLSDKTAQIYIDTSGEALFKRGYRQESGDAPLRENLAAGLLLLAGYDGNQPFQDPFCGSGTLAIEAALIAANRAPGLLRNFGFENHLNFDEDLWIKLRKQAEKSIQTKINSKIAGSDHSKLMINISKLNADSAGVGQLIDWQCNDAQSTKPNGVEGIIVTNPPYGVRLSETQILHALYPQLGSWLKVNYAGWQVAFLTGDRDMPKIMRLSPKRKIPLFNGNIDCRLFLFDMVSGSNR